MMGHLGDEPVQLLAGRQLAPDEQVGDLEEGRVLGELLDRVAAVAKDPLLAIEEGDGAGAGTGVAVAGVEGDQSGLGAQPGDVDARRRPRCPRTIGSSTSPVADAQDRRRPTCAARRRVMPAAPRRPRAPRAARPWLPRSFERANSSCSMPCTISTLPGVGRPQRVAEDEALRHAVAAAGRCRDGGAEDLAGRLSDVADRVDDCVRGAGRADLARGP